MAARKAYFADLTHTAQGISASTFPLGVSFVLSYAKRELAKELDFSLFKFPQDLDRAIRQAPPALLCFSNYSWNFEISYKIAALAKAHHPGLITVFGGPNFPTLPEEKADFLRSRPAIDFYIELEGEIGFVDLARRLEARGYDAKRFKSDGEKAANATYLSGSELVSGPIDRIKDVNLIPSPYLSGVLEGFFDHPLQPMIETTRGCPFSCTFCADGLTAKNKVTRFSAERTEEELYYIARKVKNVDELIITDLNFAMYEQDLQTARVIARLKEEFGWPILVSASAGKNRPLRTIEVARILKGTWTLGASIQSTDPEVLAAIKRKNISSAAYKDLIDYGNSLENAKTHSEIILGMPGDTKEKHFESLRFGVENGVTSMRMFQAMLLRGTEMADRPTRAKHGLRTRFRTIPGCVGVYDLFGEKVPVAEIEEIIVGNSTLPFEDYLECRVMNLLVETFYNNALFEEVFAMARAVGVSVFDCLLYVKRHPELYTSKVQGIIEEFKKQTMANLFETAEEAQSYVLTPEIIERYVGGELGINELLIHKTLLFCEFEDIAALLFTAAAETLRSRGLLTRRRKEYLDELKTYTLLRKRGCVMDTDAVLKAGFRWDFEAIQRQGYKIDPERVPPLAAPVELAFFHTPHQRKHIANQRNIYAKTPIGLGRLLQRSNMKLMYRSVARAPAVAAGV